MGTATSGNAVASLLLGYRSGDPGNLSQISVSTPLRVIGPIHQVGSAGFGQTRQQCGFMRTTPFMFRTTF